jgi:glyoxylase-like metal-dependent hydrolase (beta-lactamase superfamily II)
MGSVRVLGGLILSAAMAAGAGGQTPAPPWCRDLPRPEYKSLERLPVNDGWFEVYRVAPDTFAIYEPHQSEETISYLIVGRTRAMLFDTGMGIGNLRGLTAHLTPLPVVVLNSHTHNDHVGSNWQFDTVYSMDTSFSRRNAQGSREAAQSEIQPGETCGSLPAGFDPKAYATRPWKITSYVHDGEWIDLGGRRLQIIATPGHTPDAISLFEPGDGLLFTGDTFYPGTIWLYRPVADGVLELLDAEAGDGGDGVEGKLAALRHCGEFLELGGIGDVDLGGDDDGGLGGEAVVEGLELLHDDAEIFDGVGTAAGVGDVDEVDEDAGALDVAEELGAEAGAEVGAFDEAGHVGDDEGLSGSSPTVTTPRLGSRVVKG